MPLTPDPPFPKSQGDTLRSKDWNDAITEVIRLDNAKLNLTGGHVTGPVQFDGPLGIGTPAAVDALTVSSGAGTFIRIKGNDGAPNPAELLLGADASGGIVSTVTANDLQFRASGSNNLVIKANGKVGIGTSTPEVTLHVADVADIGPYAVYPLQTVPGRLMVTGSGAEIGFARRTLTAWPATPVAGDRFLWYSPDGTARLWTEVNGDRLTVDAAGNMTVTGDLTIPKSAGTARFTGQSFSNESSFHANNLKLQMGSAGLFGGGTVYEFAIGHAFTSFGLGGGIFGLGGIGGGIGTSFVKRFSINENGDAFFAGAKTGYVVDYFLNRSSQQVEQGDVVIIVESDSLQFYGTNHEIPIVEADHTDQAYDHRVCGIVAHHISEADLPGIDWTPATEEEARNIPAAHPMLAFAAAQEENPDRTIVAAGRFGRMATLGAFAFCKVDADISPIQAGDLLTSSPTPGHAQKVLDPAKAVGTIIGKALASLARGKGKVPVLVMLQ